MIIYVYGVSHREVGLHIAAAFFQSMFVYTSELYPSTIRTTAMGVGASFARYIWLHGMIIDSMCI